MTIAEKTTETSSAIAPESELCEVFVSHRSGKDVMVAEALAHALRERGIDCFLDVENIDSGEAFAARILNGIKNSQLVVVLFGENISPWLHFEASCAFFEKKLLPVSLNGAEVPLPYGRIEYYGVHSDPKSGNVDAVEIARLVDAIQYKLNGAKEHVNRTRLYRFLNRFFFSGFTIFFAAISALILLGWGEPLDHANHLHVILGATILGGQFFLALGFARVVSYPSARQRENSFEIAERLYWIWAIIVVIQPVLGLYLAYEKFGWSGEMPGWPEWIWLSLVLYCIAVLCTWVGYTMARGAIQLDSTTDAPFKVNKHFFSANILFLLGFVLFVAVLNIMIARNEFIPKAHQTPREESKARLGSSTQPLMKIAACRMPL
jgi:hypothetical protein